MASLGSTFNADSIDPRMQDREPIPADNYKLEIVESDVLPTKDGQGERVMFVLRVTEGPYEDRQIWWNINYKNKSAKAQEIGQREFSAVCHATGVLAPNETEELHYKPFLAKVGIEPAKGEYGPKNKVVKVDWEGRGFDAVQAPANDNKPAANDNKPPPAQTTAVKKRPWG